MERERERQRLGEGAQQLSHLSEHRGQSDNEWRLKMKREMKTWGREGEMKVMVCSSLLSLQQSY